MIAALKVALPLNLDGCVAIVVGADGGKSPPTIIDKSRFMNSMIETIRRTMFGFETAGLSSKGVFFTLPVELYILARYTLGAENGAYSVLEVVAQNSEIRLDQIGPEYPTPERTKVAFDQVNHLLLSAQRRHDQMEEKWGKAQMGLAQYRGWLESVSEEMGKAIAEFGLEDEPMDDGDQQPTIDTRWKILIEAMRAKMEGEL